MPQLPWKNRLKRSATLLSDALSPFFSSWKNRPKRLAPFLFRGVLILGAVSVLIVVLWKIPEWQADQYQDVKPESVPLLVNEYRRTLAQIIGGLGLLVGLYFTWRRIAATERNVQIAQEGQITERFTRAIEHLGSTHDDEAKTPRLEVRLGGIYALERIARDSEADHWPVMEIFTAYVRENAPWNESSPPPKEAPEATPDDDNSPTESPPPQETLKPRVDIQAILTVLGRRERRYEKEGQTLNLNETDLRGAYLREAHLGGAILWRARLEGAGLSHAHLEKAILQEAHLEGAILQEAHLKWANLSEAHLGSANLFEAHLEGAILLDAHLKRANLFQAHLEGAYLGGAHLQRAWLRGAYLEGAYLGGAHLEGAELAGAHLERAKDVTQLQIDTAIGDEYTKLPEGIQTPERWLKVS